MAASTVEETAMQILKPYAARHSIPGTFIDTREIPANGQNRFMREFVQKFLGDFAVGSAKNGARQFVEVKSEQCNRTGNLFLESWSNLSRWTYGWMHTTQADWLWYYFVDSCELYRVPMQDLREWSWVRHLPDGRTNISQYPERAQGKYDQLNDTWGWCVPIRDLQDEILTFIGPTDPTL